MRRLTSATALVLTVALAAVGCGSAGTDQQGEAGLTMAFVHFSGENITQADQVFDTVAQVDICQDLCQTGGATGGGQIMPEPFTATVADAVFVNRGKADIVLDSYTLNVPGSGVPPATRSIGARLIGGRCLTGDTQRACASDLDCGLDGNCLHAQSPVTILLYDFDFKQRVIQGECPSDLEPLTLSADITFTGSDETGERFTVDTSYVSTFANFDNCQNQ